MQSTTELIEESNANLNDLSEKLKETSSALLETTESVANYREEENQLNSQIKDLRERKIERDEIAAEVIDLNKEKERIEKHNAEFENAESKLNQVLEEYSEIKLEERKERVSLEETKREFQRLQNDIRNLATESRRLNDIRNQHEQISSELKARQEKISALKAEIEKLENLSSRLKEETNDYEVKAQKYHTVRNEIERLDARTGELGSLQTKLKKVRDQLQQSQKDKDFVEGEIKSLKDKKKTLSRAVSPEWGTVHLFGVSVIEQIDQLEKIILSTNKKGGAHLISSLEEIHNSLLAVLSSHNVELFSPQEKDKINTEDKDKIEIIDGPKGTKKNPVLILSTVRPGYICHNDGNGKSTVLRRAEVKTSKAK